MSKPQSKLRPTGLFLVLAATLLAVSCSKGEESTGAPAGSSVKKAPAVSATRVEAAVLEGGTAVTHIVRPGEVIGAREANLGAALGGYVERVLVESGQRVEKGDVIAKIDTSTHSAQWHLSKVELEDAARELERLEKLGKAIPRARVDAARTRLARARAQQRLAGTQMQRAIIKAPFSGTLVDLQIEQGEVAAPGQPIGRLLVLDPITVSVSVTDQDVGLLSKGGVALVSTTGSPTPREGSVSNIEPAANLRTRTFLVEVELPNPDHALLPGMIASVEFRPEAGGDRLLLPQDLLVTKLNANGVFVVDADSIARWRPLELGDIIGSQVEVKSGIERGDRIVTVGMRSLSDGDKVIVVRQGVCCSDGAVQFPQAASAPSREEKPAGKTSASLEGSSDRSASAAKEGKQ